VTAESLRVRCAQPAHWSRACRAARRRRVPAETPQIATRPAAQAPQRRRRSDQR
jgi:hypothetical protein